MAIFNTSLLDQTFHALSDQTRRHILATISRKKRCTAGELVELFDLAQPTISKHLKVLDKAGLVKRQVDGRKHYFSLQVDGLRQADDWINRHMAYWERSLDRLEDLLNDQKGKQ